MSRQQETKKQKMWWKHPAISNRFILLLAVTSFSLTSCFLNPNSTDTAVTSTAITFSTRNITTLPPTYTPITTQPPILQPTFTPSVPNSINKETTAIPRFEPTTCQFQTPADAIVTCGYLFVPEMRNKPTQSEIKIAVAQYHSRSSTPAPDPIIYLSGGPGANAIKLLEGNYDNFISPFLDERDFIIFDPRGTGLSEPSLSCNEIINTYLADISNNLSNEERSQQYTSAFSSCRDRLQAQGINLKAYNSKANAGDINDLVHVLGYKQVNLWGISYGTYLAQIVMRDYPSLVRSAITDSVLPLETKLYNMSSEKADLAIHTLTQGCKESSACNTAYPNLEQDLLRLLTDLGHSPVQIEGIHPLTGLPVQMLINDTSLINGLIWGMNSTELIPMLPKVIYDIQNQNTSFFSYIQAFSIAVNSNISLGVLASTNCQEQVYATTSDELASDLTAFSQFEGYGRSTIFGGAETLFRICDQWIGHQENTQIVLPLHSTIPTLIFAGQYDPTTPAKLGQQLADNLPNAYFFNFPTKGHSASFGYGNACPLQIAQSFLHTPETPPKSDCYQPDEQIAFIIPFQAGDPIEFEPYSDTEQGIQGQIPQGWPALGLGFFSRGLYVLDATQIGYQASAVNAQAWAEWLNQNFQNLGLDSPPQSMDDYTVNGTTWKLYHSAFQGNPVDLAFNEQENTTYMVAMTSHPDEHDALYKALFQPMINAFQRLP